MIVKLKQKGKVVAELEVLDDGELVIKMAGKELHLGTATSRRIAGAIVESSFKGSWDKARGNLRRHARAQLDELLDALGEDTDE